MEKEGLPNVFIVTAVKTALEFEGVTDLLNLWSKKDEKALNLDEIKIDVLWYK